MGKGMEMRRWICKKRGVEVGIAGEREWKWSGNRMD